MHKEVVWLCSSGTEWQQALWLARIGGTKVTWWLPHQCEHQCRAERVPTGPSDSLPPSASRRCFHSGAFIMTQILGPEPSRKRYRMDLDVPGDPENTLGPILLFLPGAAGGFHSANLCINFENGRACLKEDIRLLWKHFVSNHKTISVFEVLHVPEGVEKPC